MRILRFIPVLGLFLISFGSISHAQNKPAQCGVTCEPDTTSASYAPTFLVRPQTKNARGVSSVLSGRAQGTSKQSPALVGSGSYGYAIPIVSLPGRNGLDLPMIVSTQI